MSINTDTLLAWGATYKKLQSNEIIFLEGSQAHFYYQLISGSVRWININDEGKEFLQALIEPGESFGEMPLFDDCPYAATAITNEESIIIRLHISTFKQMMKENSEIHFHFSKLLTQRLRFKFLIIKELANSNPEHRIATLLNYFKEHRRNICPKCNQVKLTRQQIADMTGLRVETVIRAMRQMHDTGKLLIEKGKVYC
jgi:CRP/FNR family transcriptional regulator, cyclic AMP receptor protein